MLMNLFWTSWIPERFCLNGLIALSIYCFVRECQFYKNYRLGQLCLNDNFASCEERKFLFISGQLNSSYTQGHFLKGNYDILPVNLNSGQSKDPSGPFWSSVEPSYWSAIVLILTAIRRLKNPYEMIQRSAGFTRTEWTTGICVLLNLGAARILLVSQSWFTVAKLTGAEYSLLVRRSVIGQCLMVQSTDRMNFYYVLVLELICFSRLCNSLLINKSVTQNYLKRNAFASICLLYGIQLFSISTGQTHFKDLRVVVNEFSEHQLYVFLFSLTFIALALLWKVVAAPFHMWAVDFYHKSPSSVVLRVSTLPKLAIRGFWTSQLSFVLNLPISLILGLFATTSRILGAFGALFQPDLKRFLAFSSINHIGFFLVILYNFGTFSAGSAFICNFILYILANIVIYGITILIRGRQSSFCSIYLSDLVIRWKTHPIIAWTRALTMTSLAGIPFFAGYLGKLAVWELAYKSSHFFASINPAFTLHSVILGVCYINFMGYLFFLFILYSENSSDWITLNKRTPISAYIIAGSCLLLIVLMFYNTPIILWSEYLASSLTLLSKG